MPNKILSTPPFSLALYAQAVLPKKANTQATELPTLSYELNKVYADKSRVQKYAALCGSDSNSRYLPPLYPHMIAFPVCLKLMLSKNFPFPVMGLVHLENHVTIHRPIELDESMDIVCRFGQLKDHEKGKIIELIMEVSIAGKCVWEARSDMLAKVSRGTKKLKKAAIKPIESNPQHWSLTSNLGRRYGLVSGDINPIHLFSLSAKAFGFKTHIAHGMWTKAKALSSLNDLLPQAYTVSVEFKLPVFLPSKVSFRHQKNEQNIEFELRSSNGKKPHLKGNIVTL